MLLKWYATLVKLADYTTEFKLVCEQLQKKIKGNEENKKRFIQVVKVNRVYLIDNVHELLDAMLE